MDFVEEIDWLVFDGIVEGDDVRTLFNLVRSHQLELIDAEEMLREIDSFKSTFYKKLMQNQSYECQLEAMSELSEDAHSLQCEDSSYYAGELVPNSVQRWTREQQIALLDWHPMFTGRCPNCERSMLQTHPTRVHWDCEYCGWKDDSV